METTEQPQTSAVIVCASVSHGNTARIAEAIGQELDAVIVAPEEVDPKDLAAATLVGFGSGIFDLDFHPTLRRLVAALPQREDGKAFVFATSGFPEPPYRRYLRRMSTSLEEKGFEVIGTFDCRGFDTWLPFRLVGGRYRGRPGPSDLEAAHAFAKGLRDRV
ncbi:flavodoxin family protein [Nocardia sp. NPDC004068]|uniref:flavodoxin family protein n=1 Tax=Nocardia sp. NPDC004068 TaxID=3364303 RepID=UPI0036A76FBA